MQVSIIIVNYNVKLLLEQCLRSVLHAINLLEAEIIVVDNDSADKSVEYLEPLFPKVQFIRNPVNFGFAKACNQGAKLATGMHLLFLNPDTMLSENTITDCLSFLQNEPHCGVLGVRMLNGNHTFLKESKRGLPTITATFFKLIGLANLFPQSSFFSAYYLGNLDENKNHAVPILAGAFMMLNRNVFEKVTGFDELFFMYGEDIDLCYRVLTAGYKNYYLGTSSITHLKGKSTVKNKKQIRLFYAAMKLYVAKHYTPHTSPFFVRILFVGIWVREKIALLYYYSQKIFFIPRI